MEAATWLVLAGIPLHEGNCSFYLMWYLHSYWFIPKIIIKISHILSNIFTSWSCGKFCWYYAISFFLSSDHTGYIKWGHVLTALCNNFLSNLSRFSENVKKWRTSTITSMKQKVLIVFPLVREVMDRLHICCTRLHTLPKRSDFLVFLSLSLSCGLVEMITNCNFHVGQYILWHQSNEYISGATDLGNTICTFAYK